MLGGNTSKTLQDYYYKQDEYRKLDDKATKGDIATELRAGMHDSDEKVSAGLDSLSPLPKCPNAAQKRMAARKNVKSADTDSKHTGNN